MSTILSVTVDRSWTRPNFTDADWTLVHRQAFSIDGADAVLVTIKISAGSHVEHPYALMTVTPVGERGSFRWRHPSAAQRRALIDHLCSTRRLRRAGRSETPPAFGSRWVWQYPLAYTGGV